MEKTQLVTKVKLGSQGFEVSRMGLGCVGLSGLLNPPLPHEEGISFLQQAFNMGITFFDTADVYGDHGDNEILIGKALKTMPRDQVQIATKFGFIAKSFDDYQFNGSPEYVRKCLEASLARLDVEYIDIYYPHRVDPTIPIEETMGELKKLVEEGKIKYIGLSEASVDSIKRAHAVHPITAVQMEYSLWSRDIEEDIIPVCRELGIGIVAYSPLGHGFFGGKGIVENFPTASYFGFHPRLSGENFEHNKVLYFKFASLSRKHSCTPAQLALAWVLHQGIDIIPIPGTTKIKNMEANIGSVGVKLTAEDLEEIKATICSDKVKGEREPELFGKYSYTCVVSTPPPRNK